MTRRTYTRPEERPGCRRKNIRILLKRPVTDKSFILKMSTLIQVESLSINLSTDKATLVDCSGVYFRVYYKI